MDRIPGYAVPALLLGLPLTDLVVVYAVDGSGKGQVRRHATFIGLVKFAIIMVGLGPGLRELTRLALGV